MELKKNQVRKYEKHSFIINVYLYYKTNKHKLITLDVCVCVCDVLDKLSVCAMFIRICV